MTEQTKDTIEGLEADITEARDRLDCAMAGLAAICRAANIRDTEPRATSFQAGAAKEALERVATRLTRLKVEHAANVRALHLAEDGLEWARKHLAQSSDRDGYPPAALVHVENGAAAVRAALAGGTVTSPTVPDDLRWQAENAARRLLGGHVTWGGKILKIKSVSFGGPGNVHAKVEADDAALGIPAWAVVRLHAPPPGCSSFGTVLENGIMGGRGMTEVGTATSPADPLQPVAPPWQPQPPKRVPPGNTLPTTGGTGTLPPEAMRTLAELVDEAARAAGMESWSLTAVPGELARRVRSNEEHVAKLQAANARLRAESIEAAYGQKLDDIGGAMVPPVLRRNPMTNLGGGKWEEVLEHDVDYRARIAKAQAERSGTWRQAADASDGGAAGEGEDLTEDQRDIARECEEIKTMLLRKNRAYGSSALKPVRIMSRASDEEQILTRIDEKLSRLQRGSAAGEDVVLDLTGYLVLLLVLRRRAGSAKAGQRAVEVSARWNEKLLDGQHRFMAHTAVDDEVDKEDLAAARRIIERYMKATIRIWELFPQDPLLGKSTAHFWHERLEALAEKFATRRSMLVQAVGGA